MRHRQRWGKETCITTTLLSTTPGMSLGNTLGTAQGAPAQVRGAEPSLGESSLAGLENLILEKMLLHCFQSGAGKAVPAPGCSGQSLAGWGCWGSQGCCPETGVPQQEPCCSLLLFPPKGRFAPRAQFGQLGRAEGNTPSPCPAASASPPPPPGQPGQRQPGNSPRHSCTALEYGKGSGETFRRGICIQDHLQGTEGHVPAGTQ